MCVECLMSNRYCFNLFLKVGTEGEFLTSVGNLFHTKGPCYLILLCLLLVLTDGIAKPDIELCVE